MFADVVLSPATSVGTGTGNAKFTLGDFNRDGKIDAAVLNRADRSISLLQNNGTALVVGSTYGLGASPTTKPGSVWAAGIGCENQVGLVVANELGFTQTLEGNGAFGFTPTPEWGIAESAIGAIAADFAGSGRPAVVAGVRLPSNPGVRSRSRTGDGSCGFPGIDRTETVSEPRGMVAASLDSLVDSRLDLAVCDAAGDAVRLYRHIADLESDGIQWENLPSLALPAGSQPVSIAAGFINGDAHTDLAVACKGTGFIHTFLGRGDGTFAEQSALAMPLAASVALGDINGDGYADVLASGNGLSDAAFQGLGGLPGSTVPLQGEIVDFAPDGTLLGDDGRTFVYRSGARTYAANPPGVVRVRGAAISTNGQVVVGSTSEGQAIRWVTGSSVALIGVLPGTNSSAATDCSADGSVVVGTCDAAQPFVWSTSHGMRALADVFVQSGLSLNGVGLQSCVAVSDDGWSFSGVTTDERAYFATLPGGPRPARFGTVARQPLRGMSDDGRYLAFFPQESFGSLAFQAVGTVDTNSGAFFQLNEEFFNGFVRYSFGKVGDDGSVVATRTDQGQFANGPFFFTNHYIWNTQGNSAYSDVEFPLRRRAGVIRSNRVLGLAVGQVSSSAQAISHDGRFVIGDASGQQGLATFRWSLNDGMLAAPIGRSGFDILACVSSAGSVAFDTGSATAIWTPPSTALTFPAFVLSPGGISASGNVLVGRDSSFRAAGQTLVPPVQVLADAPGIATALSVDGRFAAGAGNVSPFTQSRSLRWDLATGQRLLIDTRSDSGPPNFISMRSESTGISSDGQTIVGNLSTNPFSFTDPTLGPFRWTAAGGLTSLPSPAEFSSISDRFNYLAKGVSGDGSRVVGRYTVIGSPTRAYAFLWTETAGTRRLEDLLTAAGVDLGGWQLISANGISADGTKIVGEGRNPRGEREAFLATIGPLGGSVRYFLNNLSRGPASPYWSGATAIPLPAGSTPGDVALADGFGIGGTPDGKLDVLATLTDSRTLQVFTNQSTPPCVAVTGGQQWQIRDAHAPPASPCGTADSTSAPRQRHSHSLAFDASRRRTVMFGGFDGCFLGETWEWDGDAWLLRTTTGPVARASAAMVFDAARTRTLLFGGSPGGRNDTWEWDGTTWIQRTSNGAPGLPPGRERHAMAYDSARNRTVLFGGRRNNAQINDTWEWNGTSWTQISPPGSLPPARERHMMAYDPDRGRVVLFGGLGLNNAMLGDTWEFDGTRWSLVATTGPIARRGAGFAFDPSRRRIVLDGGVIAPDPSLTVAHDTWEWDGRSWQKSSTLPPTDRLFHSMVADTHRGRLVSFGGINQGGRTLRSTWELSSDPSPLLQQEPASQRLVLAVQTPVGLFPSVTWRRNGQVLQNGGRISIETAGQTGGLVLAITDPTSEDAGTYTATVSTVGCGTITTNAVTVVIPSSCPADFNSDGNLDPDDLSDFIACYFTSPPCPRADYNADSNTDPDDLSDFIAAYFAGCG